MRICSHGKMGAEYCDKCVSETADYLYKQNKLAKIFTEQEMQEALAKQRDFLIEIHDDIAANSTESEYIISKSTWQKICLKLLPKP